MSRGHFSRQSNALDVKTVRADGKLPTLDSDLDKLKNRSSEHSSYERYKANLHAIFDGRAPLPTHIREISEIREGISNLLETADPVSPVSKSPIIKNHRRLSTNHSPGSVFTEALKRSSTPEEIRRAVEAFKESGHSFPMDEDLLSKALTYPDEGVVLGLLDQLESLLESQPSKNPRLLASRLEDVAFLSRPGLAKDRILKLKAKLKA